MKAETDGSQDYLEDVDLFHTYSGDPEAAKKVAFIKRLVSAEY